MEGKFLNVRIQSALEPVPEMAETTQQTVTFVDENEGATIAMETPELSYENIDMQEQASLSDFLSRPVRIANITWLESDTVGTVKSTMFPWGDFFSDSRIKVKLQNYAFLSCDLHVKVVVNASPFYYGSMIMAYQPLQGFTNSTIITDSGTRFLIPYSQRPHIWISASESKGGELTLPFVWPRSCLQVKNLSEFNSMGLLRLIPYTLLQSANGVTGAGVSVQVYAWAENVRVGGPTLDLPLQGKFDEYGTGVVSKPASIVANVARRLKDIPIISKFATATEIGASAVSNVAKLFGWTNVPVISDTEPVRPSPFANFASTEIGYPVEKLTLDAKQELTVDPGSVGLPSEDELAIKALCQRQSYLCTANWTTSALTDSFLFVSRVTPNLYDNDGTANANQLYYTPMGWVAQLFKYWRGDIIFTFRFVASPYHKGRVRIAYDPTNTTLASYTQDVGSAIHNEIVDLSSEHEVEFRVPYQQARAWLQNNADPSVANISFSNSTSPSGLAPDPKLHNGEIAMTVLTVLTAPVATSNVPIQVFVRAAENIEFANPTQPPRVSRFAVQSLYEEVKGTEATSLLTTERADPRLFRTYQGEKVESLRTLLRRTCFADAHAVMTSNTNPDVLLTHEHGKWPLLYGYDPNGFTTVKGMKTPATTYNFNWTNPSPFHWIVGAFLGLRGSMIWHYNVNNPTAVTSVSVKRRQGQEVTSTTTFLNDAGATPTLSKINAFYGDNLGQTDGGMALTSQLTNAGLSILIPNYNQYKFQTTDPTILCHPVSSGIQDDGSVLEAVALYVRIDGSVSNVNKCRIMKYFSVGTDFNVFFFCNVPTFFYMPTLPTPA